MHSQPQSSHQGSPPPPSTPLSIPPPLPLSPIRFSPFKAQLPHAVAGPSVKLVQSTSTPNSLSNPRAAPPPPHPPALRSSHNPLANNNTINTTPIKFSHPSLLDPALATPTHYPKVPTNSPVSVAYTPPVPVPSMLSRPKQRSRQTAITGTTATTSNSTTQPHTSTTATTKVGKQGPKDAKPVPRAPGFVKWENPPPRRLDRDFIYGFGLSGTSGGSCRDIRRFLEDVFEGAAEGNGGSRRAGGVDRRRTASFGDGLKRSFSGRRARAASAGTTGSPSSSDKENVKPGSPPSKTRSFSLDIGLGGLGKRRSRKEAREQCHVQVARTPVTPPGTHGRRGSRKVKYGRIVNSDAMRIYTDSGAGETEIFCVNDREEVRRQRKVSIGTAVSRTSMSVKEGGVKGEKTSRFSEALDRDMDDTGVKAEEGFDVEKERERLDVARSWLATPRAPSLHFDPSNYVIKGSEEEAGKAAASASPEKTAQEKISPAVVLKNQSGLGSLGMHRGMGSVGSVVALAKGFRNRSRSPTKRGKGSVDDSGGPAAGNRFRRFVEFYARRGDEGASPVEKDVAELDVAVKDEKADEEPERPSKDVEQVASPTHAHSKSISTVSTLSIKDARIMTLSRPGTPKERISTPSSPGPAPTAALPPVPEAASIPLPSTPRTPKNSGSIPARPSGTPTKGDNSPDKLSLYPQRSPPKPHQKGSPTKAPSVRVKIRTGNFPHPPSSLQSSPQKKSPLSSPGKPGCDWLLAEVETLCNDRNSHVPARPSTAIADAEPKTIDFAFLDRDPLPKSTGSPTRKRRSKLPRPGVSKRHSHITEQMVEEYSEEGSLGSEDHDQEQYESETGRASTDGGGCRLSGIIVNAEQAPTPASRPGSMFVIPEDGKAQYSKRSSQGSSVHSQRGTIDGLERAHSSPSTMGYATMYPSPQLQQMSNSHHRQNASIASTLSNLSSFTDLGVGVEARLSRIERMFEKMMVALNASADMDDERGEWPGAGRQGWAGVSGDMEGFGTGNAGVGNKRGEALLKGILVGR